MRSQGKLQWIARAMAEALARGERVVYASPDKSGAARMVEMVRQEADRLKKANP